MTGELRPVESILSRLQGFGDRPALGGHWGEATYADVVAGCATAGAALDDAGVPAGARVVVLGDHGPGSASVILELARRRCTSIPMTPVTAQARGEELERLSLAEYRMEVPDGPPPGAGDIRITPLPTGDQEEHDLLRGLKEESLAGLILFTSGSSGEPKVVIHDFSLLMEKFVPESRPIRMINVLLFDHWGGLNTMLRVLSSGGFAACPESRRPDAVCALVERFGLEILPASPSFLNMLLISGAQGRYDLSSLKVITYGAEPMPESLLTRMHERFPDVKLRQTYGLVELGVMDARSESDDSLLMKIGGRGFEHRVVDGKLEIRARSSMLGYLNAPSPFTEDGYFRTGDRVEQHGEYLRILGRDSEMINVGGEKVFPTEVESVLLDSADVADAVVYGEAHPLLGQVVCADVVLATDLAAAEARKAIRTFCAERLPGYQVPMKIRVVEGPLVSDRQKHVRAPRPDRAT
ncbi:MAG: ANL family adenylate-forming protein [Solirubrobacteraceae bacterium]